MNGQEMLLKGMIGALGIKVDPKEVEEIIGKAATLVSTLDARLAKIDADNAEILTLLRKG